MGDQIARMGGSAARGQIRARGQHQRGGMGERAADMRRMRALANPKPEVEPFFHHVMRRVAGDELHRQPRMSGQQRGDARGHQVAEQHRGREPHRPRCLAAAAGRRLPRGGHRFQHVAGVLERVLPVLGQGQTAGGALHEPHPELPLQRRDLAGDGRLGAAAFARHGGERTGLGHPHEGAERADQVHDHPARIALPCPIAVPSR